MRPWLVLPTFDEVESLEPVVRAALGALPPSARVLVVDDASPDGTGALADLLAAALDAVEVLHRPRREGLGPAYLAGFARALEGGATHVLAMDADGSHDPADLPRLLSAAERADVVLGSRYVPGGRIEDWGPLRRWVSRAGAAYARRVLGLPVRDPTGGFRCLRREVLDALELPAIRSRGYAFQVELTWRALRAGFRVVELPIVFRDRRHGRSKMTPRIAVEAVVVLPRLRREVERAARVDDPSQELRRAGVLG